MPHAVPNGTMPDTLDTLDITVNASTAETLNQFLQVQLTKATEGNDDRPFFDFNHEHLNHHVQTHPRKRHPPIHARRRPHRQ